MMLLCVCYVGLLPASASAKASNDLAGTIAAVPMRQRTPASEYSPIQINSFGFESMPDFSGPGCRLILATDGTEEGGEEIVFVTLGADDADGAFMQINGEFTRFYTAGDAIALQPGVYSKPYRSESGEYSLSAILDYRNDSGEYTYMAHGTFEISAANQQSTAISASGMTCH
ncbi:MAG: hypothetical protein AAFR58_26000 [Cyanobacteria bacterium J06627_28]